MDPDSARSCWPLEPNPDPEGAWQPRAGGQPPGGRREAGRGPDKTGTADDAAAGLPLCQPGRHTAGQDTRQGCVENNGAWIVNSFVRDQKGV